MPGWTRHEGLAVPLPLENVDTDQLIPARFMATPRAQGYGRFLLHDLRHDAEGRPDATFPLNRPEAAGASILIAGRNFGAGSSREAAVYALADAGFRAVIAPTFSDIFASNAVNNGLLPARLAAERIEALLAGGPRRLAVDLAAGTIEGDGVSERFDLDPIWAKKLINGWDDIDLTRAHLAEIEAFAERRQAGAQWVWPARQAAGG
jgi:3-isopropylmalate/(R)-2-methylmalate dehydratase small subunit